MFAIRKARTIRNFINVFEGNRNKLTTTNFAKKLEYLKKPVRNYSSQFSSNLSLEMQKEAEQFMLVYPDIVRDLTQFNHTTPLHHELMDAEKHFKRALNYNVPNGKKNRGLTVVTAYKDLMVDKPLTPEQIRQAQLLGWCMEIVQYVFIIADDIIDRSEIRRNKPCWYKVADVKEIAINDMLMMENGCYHLLKQHFGHLPCYVKIIELMHEMALTTIIGESLDLQMSNTAGVTRFTASKYRCMTDCKASHYTVYTPNALAMILAGYNDEELFNDIKEISNEIGHFYQVQNDFLDCFGEPGVLKKPGTDIEDGKCTWLATQAMELGSDEQKEIMKKCYGINDPECINNVKKVYNDLDLPEIYKRFKEKTYDNTIEQIEKTLKSDKLLQNVMMNSLNRAIQRT